jgi:hypothetical protein
MKFSTRYAFAALAIFTAGCAFRRTPVPLIGDSSVKALVGNWAGDYSSSETGRAGSITFSLASERDTAYGDVTMIPRTHVTPIQTSQQQAPVVAGQNQFATEPLAIRFVRLEGGTVSGRLAPYTDPQCECRVVTTFQGRLTSNDTIEGTYDTRGASFDHQPSAGKWKVTRQATPTTN